jgi:hypothetical protein
MAPSPIIPTASATPAATDNRFPIIVNHPRFLLPVCCLMRFDSCLGFVLSGQMGLTGLTGLTELTDFSLQLFNPDGANYGTFARL